MSILVSQARASGVFLGHRLGTLSFSLFFNLFIRITFEHRIIKFKLSSLDIVAHG